MGKHYDIGFKSKILNEYLKGQGGSIYLGKKYNIPSHTIDTWIKIYKRQGNLINVIKFDYRDKERNGELFSYGP